jgi:bifunctional non-homologous end joining protein LigD
VGSRGSAHGADQLVLDLDPGPPATVVECCAVALLLRDLLQADGLAPVAKTSGSKGLQVYVAIQQTPAERTSAYARGLAQRLEAERGDLVVSRMTKSLRPGKVLVDWSQNNAAKTTVSVYSLRARPLPTVSTPVTWDEVGETAEQGGRLQFTAGDVLARVEDAGDLFAPLLSDLERPRLP